MSRRVCLSGFLAALCCVVCMLGGCATSPKTADLARDAFAAGDVSTAHEILSELSAQRGRLSDAAALDLAIVELAKGDAKAAERRLRGLRDRFDALPKIAPLHDAASLVTDDLSRVYRPAGYEEVMVRAMLAVSSLATDGADAESYALQATVKQTELANEAQNRGVLKVDELFQPVALAPYLRGVLREATHHDYDDAARAYQLVSDVRPDFQPAQDDLARATGGVHSAPHHGVLYVIGCVGRGPMLQEGIAETTTAALSIAGQLLSHASKEEDGDQAPTLPNVASVKVPRVVLPPSNIAAIQASFVGEGSRVEHLGTTQTLTDVAELAANQVSAEMPWTIARAVVRRVTKEAAVARVGSELGLDGSTASMFQFAAGSLWSSRERADTRCWGMLPREIQVLRIELRVGSHTIDLTPVGFSSQPIGQPHRRSVEISDGRNHYLIVVAPNAAIYTVGN